MARCQSTPSRPPNWAFTKPGFVFSVPSSELVRSNLVDRASRHIMLLTHNAAALQLLFDGGILKEEQVDVLCTVSAIEPAVSGAALLY
jgi:hypothetical protein